MTHPNFNPLTYASWERDQPRCPDCSEIQGACWCEEVKQDSDEFWDGPTDQEEARE